MTRHWQSFVKMANAGNNEPEPSSDSESTPSTTANPSIPEIRREREVVSLLDRLRSPAASELSRKKTAFGQLRQHAWKSSIADQCVKKGK